MGLADFWNNITTPGFLSNMLDDLKDIGRETREEFREILEDGEELVTDAFRHTVIEEKGEYTFTSERRKAAREEISMARKRALATRGVDSSSEFLFGFMDWQLKQLMEQLETGDTEIIADVTTLLTERLFPLHPVSIEQLATLRKDLLHLLILPEPPTYRPVEDIPSMTSTHSHVEPSRNRSLRHKATSQFVEEAQRYVNELEHQTSRLEQDGPFFALDRLTAAEQEYLVRFCQSMAGYQINVAHDVAELSRIIGYGMTGKVIEADPAGDQEKYRQSLTVALERLSCIFWLIQKAVIGEDNDKQEPTPREWRVIEGVVHGLPVETSTDSEGDEDEE